MFGELAKLMKACFDRKTAFYRVSARVFPQAHRDEFIDQLTQTSRYVRIVCGQFAPQFYDAPAFIRNLRNFIDRCGTIEVITNANANSLEEATQNIAMTHKNLSRLLLNPTMAEIYSHTPDHLRLYWCPIKPKRQYAIFNELTSLVEDEHASDQPRDTYCFKNDEKTAQKWIDQFNKMQKLCKKINLEALAYTPIAVA
jgi:uncharacterized protein YecE (DUF72 family)